MIISLFSIGTLIKEFKIRRLISKISEENLDFLSIEELRNTYILKKFIDWQNDHDGLVTWEEFKEDYFQCVSCKNWSDTPCICYAR